MTDVRGRSSGHTPSEANRIIASRKSGDYTALQTTVSDGAADTSVADLVGGSDFLSPLGASRANYFEIYSDKDVYVKFRTVQNKATATASLKSVKIRANTTRVVDWIADVTAVYVSNSSGATANIDLTAI